MNHLINLEITIVLFSLIGAIVGFICGGIIILFNDTEICLCEICINHNNSTIFLSSTIIGLITGLISGLFFGLIIVIHNA
ncbi:putative membrane protein [Acanthamoeba castellanii mamavirus]|nr:putative membrane protein [Acanthamoeba castellanii mamavirus]